MSPCVFTAEGSVQYEWSRYGLYRHPTQPGKYASFTDSGCSCGYWMEPTDEQLHAETPMTRAQARDDFKRYLACEPWYYDAGDVIRELESFEDALNAEEHP